MEAYIALLLFAQLISSLAAGAVSHEGACLQDGRHKVTPSPEPHLTECSLYSQNSCCSEADVLNLKDLGDKCGPLTPRCESFLKRVSCFHRCSPHAAHWTRPQSDAPVGAVPLCHSFCRDWFQACKSDLTLDPRAPNRSSPCVPYQQVYTGGRDLCQGVWGGVFRVVEDQPGVKGLSTCVMLSASDESVMSPRRRPPGATYKRSLMTSDPEGSGSGF